ncbi:MAG TPA: hypothetical protein VN728_07900 [Stellaceae bacterium]|nr:hypothetical protein [Stellaceae bacterium]
MAATRFAWRENVPDLFLRAARTALAEIAALLARERKWRRDRAALATMDYAALRDIGFASAPWNADHGASDQFARNIAWSRDKQLRALLDDCSRARDAAQAAIRANPAAGSGNIGFR